jgi:hypothetical protein
VAKAIRDARATGNHDRAIALGDAWRERIAICIVDGGLGIAEAEMVASEEIQGTT